MSKKKLVVFSIGGKGGVGKSWLVTLLADWYASRKQSFHAVDLDNENNTLMRFYPAAQFVELSSERELDGMLNAIVGGDQALTLMDMRAASTDRVEPWLRQVDFEELSREHSIKFTAIGVVDTSEDSVNNIGYWAGDVLKKAKGMRYIIAQNKVRGTELAYEKSSQRKQYRERLDLAEIEIPKLDEWVHAKLESENKSVGAALAVDDAKSPFTEFMTRARLKRYQGTMFAEFEKVKERLLP